MVINNLKNMIGGASLIGLAHHLCHSKIGFQGGVILGATEAFVGNSLENFIYGPKKQRSDIELLKEITALVLLTIAQNIVLQTFKYKTSFIDVLNYNSIKFAYFRLILGENLAVCDALREVVQKIKMLTFY